MSPKELLFQSDKKILLVSDYRYQPFLFRYKNDNPSLDIKFMDKKELIDLLSFTYLKDPIPYLIKEKGIEYNKAKKYLNLLKSSGYAKNPTLNALYNELLGEYIPYYKDDLALYELKQYQILIKPINTLLREM